MGWGDKPPPLAVDCGMLVDSAHHVLSSAAALL